MNEIEKFFGQFQDLDSGGILRQLLYFGIWLAFILLAIWLTRLAINRSIKDNAIRYRAKKITNFAGYAVVIFLAIVTFTGSVKYFSIAIGIVSAGVAFALQEVLLSFAGWIAIFSADIYKTGDRIKIGDVQGDVIDIGFTRTTLMEMGDWISSDNYNGRIVQISNSFVFKGPVYNYSSDFPFLWDELNLPLKYGSDLQLARQIVMDAAHDALGDYASFAREHWKKMVKKYLIENAVVEPSVSMKLTDNWISLNLRYVVAYEKRRTVKNQLHSTIYDKILQADGKVSIASATFEVVGVPEIRIRTK